MQKKTHEEWVEEVDVKLISCLSNPPKTAKEFPEFMTQVMNLIPFSSLSQHSAMDTFKAIDSETDEIRIPPIEGQSLARLEGYYERNILSVHQACAELIRALS